MIAIGITSGSLLPPFVNGAPDCFKVRMVGYKGTRLAAAVYKMHQTHAGHWVWQRTNIIGETRMNLAGALKDARELSEQWGCCRIYAYGIGGRKVN